MLGSVKWFTDAGGYGFIERSDGQDVFVHYTAIVGERCRTLSEGDVVEFEIVQGAHGPQAVNAMVRPRTDRGHSKSTRQLWDVERIDAQGVGVVLHHGCSRATTPSPIRWLILVERSSKEAATPFHDVARCVQRFAR